MTEHVKIIDGEIAIKPTFDWAYGMVRKGLPGGAVEVVVRRHQEGRSSTQNSKQWAMYADLENQLTWHGEKLSKEDWKILLCNEWKPQRIIPAISGGFCVLNAKTSKAPKNEMIDLIEIVYAFGSANGVKWSEPALKEYESWGTR